jgi:MFS family permease
MIESDSRPATLAALNQRKPLWPVGSLVILSGLNLLDYLDRQILSAVLPPLQAELHLGDEQAGNIGTAFMLGYFLTSPLFGYLGDRLPRRWLVAAGVFVWSLGTLLSGHAHAYAMLIVFRVLVGFGEASFGTISPGWIADLFSREKRNTAISWFYLAIPVGSAIGYILGSHIAAHYGWRMAFVCAGYPGLLLAFLLFLLREPARGATETAPVPETSHATGWRMYFELFTFPSYVLVIAGYVAQTFALGGFAFWAPSFLVRAHHMELAAAGGFFGQALVVMGLLATLGGGYVATAWQRRTGRGYAWMLAISALGAVPAAFATFALRDLALAKTAMAASMFFLFLCTGPLNTLILETVPVRMRASAVAASIFCIHMFGDLWSPKVVGHFADRWNDLPRACLYVLPGSLVISAALWCWLVVWTKRNRALAASDAGR